MRLFQIFIILAFNSVLLNAQTVSIEALPDTNKITVGDQINFTIKVNKPADYNIEFPVLQQNLDKGIEILEENPMDTIVTGENIQQLVQSYLVTSFDSGLYYIPPLDFVMYAGAIKDTLRTAPSYLLVNPFYIEELGSDIADITEIEKIPYRVGLIITIILLCLILIAGGIFLYFYIKDRNKVTKIFQKPQIPHYVIAEKELDELKSKKLWQQNKLKEYYTELTQILRKYIENQFAIKALEQTTDEILKEVKRTGLFDQGMIAVLAQMLPLADLIKFAKGEANPDENALHLENAYKFVSVTRKQFEVIEEETQNTTEQ